MPVENLVTLILTLATIAHPYLHTGCLFLTYLSIVRQETNVGVIPSRTTIRLAMASGTDEPAAINVRLITESGMFHV